LDLWKILDKPDFLEIKLGKKRLWIAVGEWNLFFIGH
jgi:hypothetical protein